MVLIGDAVHNFIDGVIIASAFAAGTSLGVSITVAIILHEIPQELGDFDGVRDGSPVGLLFPASLVRRGEWLYITNLSLDLRPTGQQSVDSQWAAMVKTHSISRIRFHIPGNNRDAD